MGKGGGVICFMALWWHKWGRTCSGGSAELPRGSEFQEDGNAAHSVRLSLLAVLSPPVTVITRY